MGELVKPQAFRLPADVPRQRWTVDDVFAMQEAGVRDDSCELIEGEIVPKMPNGGLHDGSSWR